MKYAGLLLAFFLCFVAVNGFCKGNAEAAPAAPTFDADKAKTEADLKKEKERADQLQSRLDQMSGAPAPVVNAAPVPITREILAQVNQYRQDLNRLNYFLSMNLVMTVNKNDTGVNLSDDGKIRYTERNTQNPIRISARTAGRKESNVAQDSLGNARQFFEIAFPDQVDPEKKYYLKFIRNDKDNCFDLESVETDGIIYGFSFDGLRPHLCVYYEYASDDASRIEVQGRVRGTSEARRAPPIEVIPEVEESFEPVPISESAAVETNNTPTQPDQAQADPQTQYDQVQSDYQTQPDQLADASDYDSPDEDTFETVTIIADSYEAAPEWRGDRNINAIGDMFVMGEGTLKIDPVADFIWAKNRGARLSDIKEIIRIYVDESRQEGVNSDIAIAQMCHATNYLNDVRFYNYAGLSSDTVGLVRFSTPRDGVIAHIQHLKGYASSERPREPIVDPRFDILGREGLANTVKTFDDLFAKWSPRYGYGSDVKDKLKLLYQVSDSQI